MAVQQFRLPDPGEGLVEADIVTWRVAVGDQVQVNDILLEVETSKSLVELPSPYAGTVSALLVPEGETVDVGSPIISIDDGVAGAAGSPAADSVPAAPEPDSTVTSHDVDGAGAPGGRVAVLVGYGPRTTDAKRRPRKNASGDQSTGQAHEQAADIFSTAQPVSRRADDRTPMPPNEAEPVGAPLPGPGTASDQSPPVPVTALAKPPVRRLAKDLGVDLQSLTGSGPGGVITREDVEAAGRPDEAGEQFVPYAPLSGEGLETRIPIKGVRRATAQAMVRSAFTAPHVTEWVTVDVTATMELVDRLKGRREFADIKVTPLLIVIKAVLLALRRTPELNSSWDDEAQQIVIKHLVNLGIAAATPRGLLVPNIKGASSLDLADLGSALQELVAVARAGRTQPADTAGGTFTITNVGIFGVDAGTPILNPGEAGILCVGQIARRPWVVGIGSEERIEPRWVTTLALSFDHRLVDGEQGSRFLADVASILADPGLALLH